MDALRGPMMDAAREARWLPAFGLERELDWLRNMGDWMISKKRYWGAQIKPDAFRLQCDEADLGDYQFGTMSGHHRFCKNCGVSAFGHGYIEAIGGDYVSINVACLDTIEQSELAELPIQYFDGRNNAWWNTPEVTKHL